MSYKCLECGHVFEEGEQFEWTETHGFTSGPFERMSGCPMCRGAYEEMKPCKGCREEALEDDLYCGFCLDCLKESLTYDTFLAYLESTGNLAHFMFTAVYDSDIPDRISLSFMDTLRELFLRKRADDLLCRKSEFLDLCHRYVFEDDGICGILDYAEWRDKSRKLDYAKLAAKGKEVK